MTGQPFTCIRGTYPNALLAVEIAFGADLTDLTGASWTWTDVTADVMFEGGDVSIVPMGRGDETSKAQPAGCKFQLLNLSGDYSKGPGSVHFPYVRRNTPVRQRVTLDGATWYTRFQGYVNGFIPSWDITGTFPVVTVSASGILRRLQQRKSPLKSPLQRAVAALNPLAHWPFEDSSDATRVGSAIAGGAPLSIASGTVTFASVDIVGAQKAPELVAARLGGSVPAGTNPNGWLMYVAFRATRPAGVSALIANVLRWGTTDGDFWRIEISNFFDFDGSPPRVIATDFQNKIAISVNGTTFGVDPFDGKWHNLAVLLTNAGGGNLQMDMYLDQQHFASTQVASFAPLGGPLYVVDASITGANSLALSNLAFVETTSVTIADLNNALAAWVGETATARLSRLCAEEGVPIAVIGTADTTMGAQGADTFINLLRECETTDDGVLYDGRAVGLSYTARTSRYNATAALTADMAAKQVAAPFRPVDDDQRNLNKCTVKRKNGSLATVEDTDGPLGTAAIGTYDGSVSPDPNYATDDVLPFRASHEVKKGTVQADYRYPTLSLDLGAVPALASSWLTADVSSRINVTNVASAATNHPPGDVDLLLEGWAEILSPFDWIVPANCSPFAPWRVGVVDDTAARVGSASSTLQTGVAAGATSLSVLSATNELWSTSAGDYPRDVSVGGIAVTVTAVSGASSPQTFTVSPVSRALTAGWAVNLLRPIYVAL